MNKILISKLPQPEQHGDWHDKPLKWLVSGPANETQKFATKEEAKTYKRLRRSSADQSTAIRNYAGTN